MSENSQEQIPTREAEQRRPIRVLIAEDEKLIVPLLEETFRMAGGFSTTVVEKTEDALGALREAKDGNSPIDLVFSDLGLADNDEGGYKIAEAVRDGKLADYFILFTGRAAQIEDDPDKLRGKGIDKLLPKPISPVDLIRHLNEAREAILKPEAPQQ